ncbi:MAG TPA: hypothetical protein V6C71_04740 [Coleofasciculaceae cyanobacterium]|jgi:hypothetical protein
MDDSINNLIIYPNIETAAAAVCRKWCQQQGYTDSFYLHGSWWTFPPQGVMPVKIHHVIDLAQTKAERVLIKYYSIALSVALLPDGCIAPHNHPEV